MKKITLLLFLPISTIAGRIGDLAVNNPEQILQTIQAGIYSDVLALAKDAYLESKVPGGESLAYVWVLALSQSAPQNRLRLALDFSLAQSDAEIAIFRAREISDAVLGGTVFDANLKQELIGKLKAVASQIVVPNQESFNLAFEVGNALILLGEDAGLDIRLTDAQEITNLSANDKWTSTSGPELFQQLRDHYAQIGNEAAAGNPEYDRILSAAYELCRVRRLNGFLIQPLAPLVSLARLAPK